MHTKLTIVFSKSLAGILVFGTLAAVSAEGQSLPKKSRREIFTPGKQHANEGPAGYFYIPGITKAVDIHALRPGRTGYDNLTNGFLPQGPDFDKLNEDNVVPGRSYNDNRFVFEEVEGY